MDCSSIYEPEPDVAGQAVSNIKKTPTLPSEFDSKNEKKTHLKKSPGLHSFLSPYSHFPFPGLGHHTGCTNSSTSGAEFGL